MGLFRPVAGQLFALRPKFKTFMKFNARSDIGIYVYSQLANIFNVRCTFYFLTLQRVSATSQTFSTVSVGISEPFIIYNIRALTLIRNKCIIMIKQATKTLIERTEQK